MRITMGSKVTKGAAALLFACYMLPAAMAQVPFADNGAPAPAPAKRSLFKECAEKNGIDITNPRTLTPEQRKVIYACVKTTYKEVRVACATETGVTLPAEGSGQRLSPEDRMKITKCMKAKGLRVGHHRCDSDNDDGSGMGGNDDYYSANE